MGKNILVISASPRKDGNSDILCSQFLEGARQAGHKAEKVNLREKTLNFCLGCEHCVSHKGVCVHKDDMAPILEAMLSADVLVLATPVYFYTMDAQLKTLIDRCVARYEEMRDKEFYFIATAADNDPHMLHRTFDGLRGFTSCLPGAREKGVLAAHGVWKKGDVQGKNFMRTALDMGKAV